MGPVEADGSRRLVVLVNWSDGRPRLGVFTFRDGEIVDFQTDP
jgi:hypothetical protein